MSAITLKPCCICGNVSAKKARGRSSGKDVCRGAFAHRECLTTYCVLCLDYATAPFRTCLSCGAKIHESCAGRESRRPEGLGHKWTAKPTENVAKVDPGDVEEDLDGTFDVWSRGGRTHIVGIGDFLRR